MKDPALWFESASGRHEKPGSDPAGMLRVQPEHIGRSCRGLSHAERDECCESLNINVSNLPTLREKWVEMKQEFMYGTAWLQLIWLIPGSIRSPRRIDSAAEPEPSSLWSHLARQSVSSVLVTGASDAEKALMKTLFIGYNLKVRPAVNPEERVVVRVGMVLSSFVGLVRHGTLRRPIFTHTYTHYEKVNETLAFRML
ncbi:hypothetical protein EYF80_049183 [Liparis tanakae]|uniref:Uncharacterized protein n=1 Tax=Liparis tanakae TaxID=230148 RepID=A0A4Z2FIP0_9TELE|nr:hypothetical protein EYF80_049183 [Liparis tanakae]